MPVTMSEHDKTRAAAAQVDAQIGFYIHLVVYVLAIAVMAAIDYQSGKDWWVQWPALGWGIGILGHALGVFGRSPGFIASWRLRKIEQLRNR